MGIEELQGKFSKDFFFSKKIKKEEEELFIMRYKVLTRRIKGLTDSFIVDVKRLKELLLINNSKSYCKFYYLQENKSLNIGLSFSDDSTENFQTDDALYVLEEELFIEKEAQIFKNMVDIFKNDIGDKISKLINTTTTSMISYDFETVDSYIMTLELHMILNHLKFNMFRYRSTDLNGEILTHYIGKDDQISFCVHALIDDSKNDKVFVESIGYDFGTVYP
nr:hypothetical protein [uncultured Flavobacterium sp.]